MADGGDLGFSFRATKAGDVAIVRDGRVVVVLRGAAAQRFLAAAGGATAAAAQQLMARATGNYRRGNERGAARHPRRRAGG
ncbi:MAG: hypothetical protein IPM22_06590 [Betaproteobacteria bacterium]|nr:hypothetical protein [Betaproteobacteria bacterium]MCC7215791.1 hypothetical protein [Burkholderiales bacterium]